VKESSATFGGPKIGKVGLPVDHKGLNKFESRNHSYNMILSQLVNTIKSVYQPIRRRYAVPLEAVHTYTPRHELSEALEQKLKACHGDSSISHAVAIYGLGGVGKSQLALKYAEDHKYSFDPILWIDATDEASVRSSFKRCATELDIPVDRSENEGSSFTESRAVQAVLRWLRDRKDIHDEWLVIIDNADDCSWGIKKVIPKGKRGNIIITSRDNLSPLLVEKGCEQLEVNVMTPVEARTLLLRRLRWNIESCSEKHQLECDAVVQHLGYLAGAIDLAGAYISMDTDQEGALSRYLADYDRHQDDLLKIDRFRGLLPTEKTIWTVWDTTLKKLDKDYADLQPSVLLSFLAHFKGNIVQDEIFRLASLGIVSAEKEMEEDDPKLPSTLRCFLSLHSGKWDDFSYRRSRDILLRYALLQRVEGEWPGVTMHSLVQWRAMQNDQDLPWGWWYIVFVLAACCKVRRMKKRPYFRRHLTVHLPDANEAQLIRLKISISYRIFIWNKIGRIYYNEGRLTKAEELQMQVMKARKEVFDVDHPHTLSAMSNLAETYRNQGRWDEAEELQMSVMEVRKKVLGVDHPDTLISMGNLAKTYRNQGRWDEAEELQMSVMEVRKKVLGVDHPHTLISMNSLSLAYWGQGRTDEATTLMEECFELRKRTVGADHRQTLFSSARLTRWRTAKGRTNSPADIARVNITTEDEIQT
jgi:tetratricopeptide (TPR) repeat protein